MLVDVGVEVLLGPQITFHLVYQDLFVTLLLTRSVNNITSLIIISVSAAMLVIEF